MLNREKEREREEKKTDERESEDMNGAIIHKNCSTTVSTSILSSSIQLGTFSFFLKFIIDVCMKMSRCQIVFFSFFLLLLINRSSLFDNNDDHDCIMQLPTGNRRLNSSSSS